VAGTKSTISSAATKVSGPVALGPSAAGSSSDLLKATITGTLFLDPAAMVDIHPDLIVTGGLASQSLAAARNDALAASACFAGLAPTRTLNSMTSSMTISGNGGLNVIKVGSVVLVKQVLTLSGGPNDVFIFNVSGDFSLGSSQIKLVGGVTASQVLWNFPGTGTTVNVYKDVTSACGTFLVPFRDYVQDVAALNGAVICGGNVRIHSGATVTYPSGCTP
jgi:choice-of-anchor A domain-containing protein